MNFSVRSLCLAALLSFLATSSPAAVSLLGTAGSVFNNGTLSSFTVPAGTNRLLVVSASDSHSLSVTGVTFAGQSLTLAVVKDDTYAIDSFWYLVMGTSASATTGNVVVTTSGTTDRKVVTAAAFQNVNQSTPISGATSNQSSLTTSSLTIASTSGDLIYDLFDAYATSVIPTNTANSGQTVITTAGGALATGNGRWSTSTKPGAASVSTGWSYNGTALIQLGINLKQAPSNTAPTFVGSASVTIAQNTSTSDNIKGALHASDTDSAQTLTWTVTTAPAYGVVSSFATATASSGSADITPGGTLTYTPRTNFSGIDTFVVQVSDGTATASRTVSVTVSGPTYTAPNGTATGVTLSAIGYGFTSSGSLTISTAYTNQNANISLATLYRGESQYAGLGITNSSGSTNSFRSGVWADLNNDGDFTDTNEQRTIYSANSLANGSPSNTTTSGLGFVPIDFPGTTLRVRFIARLGTTSPAPNDTGYTGEYIDAYVTIAANTAPSLNTGLTVSLPDVVSNDTDPAGIDLKALIDNAGSLITDPDPTASSYQGLALTGYTGTGTWQSGTTDSGTGVTTWINLPALSDANAFLCKKNDSTRVRFVPGATGSFSLTFRAWDQTQGTTDQTYNITGTGGFGGTRAFSSATMTATGTSYDAATGGSGSLYLMDPTLGRVRVSALNAAAGTVLPPRTIPSTRAELLGGDRLAYDSANDYIYWKSYNTYNVHRVKPDGTGYQALYTADPNNGPYITAFVLKSDNTALRYAFYAANGNVSLYGASLATPATSTSLGSLVASLFYDHMAWDGTSVFYNVQTSPQKIVKTGASAGAETTLMTSASGYTTYGLDLDSTRVFWIESNGTTHTLKSMLKDGSVKTSLATLPTSPTALRVDSTNGFIYVATSSPHSLYRAVYPTGASLTKILTLGFAAYGIDLQTAVADTTPPTVSSIVRQTPTGQALTAGTTTATFRVTFSEAVNTPATSNFAVVAVNSSTIVGSIASVTSVSTSIYDVAVTVASGSGEFRLKVLD